MSISVHLTANGTLTGNIIGFSTEAEAKAYIDKMRASLDLPEYSLWKMARYDWHLIEWSMCSDSCAIDCADHSDSWWITY